MSNKKIDWMWELRATIVRSIILVLVGFVGQKYLGMSLLMSIGAIFCVSLVMMYNNNSVNTWINNKIFGQYH